MIVIPKIYVTLQFNDLNFLDYHIQSIYKRYQNFKSLRIIK